METAKRWFGKFRSKEKPKTSKTKNEPRPSGKERSKTPLNEETPSNATKQKVAAAKEYIEKHYKEQMKSLQERRERRNMLEKKLADAQVSEEEQNNLLKYLEKKETEYMRRQRHKMGADDFEPLTMIGKGAFGEVRICREKSTGHVYAMKKLKKSEMLRRGQVVSGGYNVCLLGIHHSILHVEDSKLEKSFEIYGRGKLSVEAKDRICKLLCNVEQRLGTRGTDKIKSEISNVHFILCKLENLVRELMQQKIWLRSINFVVMPQMLTSKDVNFMGYTYKNFITVNDQG
ncbi:UNVERIFIED_CONTAM: putative serine/threonine-protein kinase ndrA [Sesamum angustifolium]|uniref:non-specific serine/threonine protein kinase n=1 Tax=Sesamum angustifolium TaxID=2727405 RepID=A0AAW2LVN8_9LAMI